MRPLLCGLLVSLLAFVFSCGNDHPKLIGMTVSPAMATAMVNSSVMFTAMGRFDNNTSQVLSPANGLKWTSSNMMIATVNVNGMATCMMPGTAVVTATMPTASGTMMGTMMQPGASTMSATTSLTCM